MPPVIQMQDIQYSYEKNPALTGVNLSVNRNDFGAIIGPNGGGKTTLLKLILGFIRPLSGEISIFGKSPLHSSKITGYVPQFAEFDKNFPMTVTDVVCGGLLNASSFFPFYSKSEKEQARSALHEVGIPELENKVFGKLSGGQKQRALIARAIVSKPKILLLDEPTTSVDSNIERDIYELLNKLNKDVTILLVTHDLGFVSNYINRVICVNKRVDDHDPSSIDDQVIEETYNTPMNLILHRCKL